MISTVKLDAKVKAFAKKVRQEFWMLMYGEADFYLRISDAIGKCAGGHQATLELAYEAQRAALVKQFIIHFTTTAGVVDWRKVVAFNSSSTKARPILSLKES